MGFGLSSITNAVKNAVNTVSGAVGGAAHKVEEGAGKVADVIKSAVESVRGHDGFDDHPHGPLAESKPKGGSGSSSSYA